MNTPWAGLVLVVFVSTFTAGAFGRHIWGLTSCAQAEYQGQTVQFCGQRLTVTLVTPRPTPSLPEIKERP